MDVKFELLMKRFWENGAALKSHVSGVAPTLTREETFIAWSYPPPLMVNLNVDGASKGNPRCAGCGCVIRDHHKRWLIGADQNLGICTAFQAEIWVAFIDLRLAWEHRFRHVILEIDSSSTYQLLTASSLPGREWHVLVAECKAIMSRDWMVIIKHVYHEANYITDGVANWVISQNTSHYLLRDPPFVVSSLLFADLCGVSRARVISISDVEMEHSLGLHFPPQKKYIVQEYPTKT